MQNSLLIGLSKQVALRQSMDTIANNMANMNTAGYKSDEMMFEEYLMPVAKMNEHTGRDRTLSYVDTPGIYRDFAAGDMEQTGGELDVAISGEGWLVVDTPAGERYTRNGQLKLNTEGTLVTTDGFPVLGDGGPLVFAANETNVTIAEDGTISSSEGAKGRLRLVSFETEEALKKVGDTLFEANEDAQPQPSENGRIMQGMIEKSNVNSLMEMTRMIETIRAYTSISQSIERSQKLREEAINQLGQTGGN